MRWDLLLFAGPPVLAMAGATLALLPGLHLASLWLAVTALIYIFTFLSVQLGFSLGSVQWVGMRRTAGRAASQSLPAYRWSVPLVHQPEAERVDELLQLVSTRLTEVIRRRLRDEATKRGNQIGDVDVVETVVYLIRGVTTERTRSALTTSAQVVAPYGRAGDVVIFAAGRLDERYPKATTGGGFLLVYLFGLAVVVGAAAVFVASVEANVCGPDACAGRPATYPQAVAWLAHRLLLSDPTGLVPATWQAVTLGWLTSLAGLMTIPVVFVAVRQQIKLFVEASADYTAVTDDVMARARVLILVVNQGERDAVFSAIRKYTRQEPTTSFDGGRTIFDLGRIAGADVMLAQPAEQGSQALAAIMATAQKAIRQCRPDYVILTGICYGLRPEGDEQRIGDILISRWVQAVDHKVASNRTGDVVIAPRSVNSASSRILLERCEEAQASWRMSGPRVHFGTTLSSNILMDSQSSVKQLKVLFPDAIGGNMEGLGVFEATAADERTEWIMINAISDWGYGKKYDHDGIAAANAAEFVAHMISLGALDRRPFRDSGG